MYVSLSGSRATATQLDNLIFESQFMSLVTATHPSLQKPSRHMTLAGLTRVISNANLTYGSRYAGAQLTYKLARDLGGGIGEVQSKAKKLEEQVEYGVEERDSRMAKFLQQFCECSLDADVDIGDSLHSALSAPVAYLLPVANSLQQINQSFVQTPTQHSSNLPLHRSMLNPACFSNNDDLKTLLQHVQVAARAETPTQIITQIMAPAMNKCRAMLGSQLARNPLLSRSPASDEEKWQLVLVLWVIEDTAHQELNELLYRWNWLELHQLLQRYSSLISRGRASNVSQIQQYLTQAAKWSAQCKSKHARILSYCLTWKQPIQFEIMSTPLLKVHALLDNTIKWLSIVDSQDLFQQIMSKFVHERTTLEFYLQGQAQKELGACCLLDYGLIVKKVTVPEASCRLAIFALLEKEAMSRLLTAARSELSIEYFQQQLMRVLLSLTSKPKHHPFMMECTRLLSVANSIKILTSHRDVVESIDWSHLPELIPKPTHIQFFSQLIRTSIELYHNAGFFLNTGFNLDALQPHFQLDILLLGLKDVLTRNIRLTEKQRANFLGMIEVYRDERLPQHHQYKQVLMEMLFEWYILKEYAVEGSYKSLSTSLGANLETEDEAMQAPIFSMRMTESTKIRNSARIHNHRYTRKIVDPSFIEKLNQMPGQQDYYISYMHVVCESICQLRVCRQKIIKAAKLQTWVGLYLDRLKASIKASKGGFYKKLNQLKDKSMALFSQHFN